MADDGRWAYNCLDQDVLDGSWLFKSFLDRQSKVVSGSDWFVSDPVPLKGIHAAVSRKTYDGEIFNKLEAVGVLEAVVS